jgi:peroxiredoxin
MHRPILLLLAPLTLLLTACATSGTQMSAVPELQPKLDQRKAEFTQNAPPEMVQDFDEGVRQVRSAGVTGRALKEGDRAPDFELPNAAGRPVKLSRLLERGPVVLTWYRGGWCPYCNLQLRTYQEILPQIEEYGATLVAISPETPDHAYNTRSKGDLSFTVLSDVGNHVARQYGLVYKLPGIVQKHFKGRVNLAQYNNDRSNELPLAVTYVVDRDGTIRYAFVDADYRKRAEPADILKALRALR